MKALALSAQLSMGRTRTENHCWKDNFVKSKNTIEEDGEEEKKTEQNASAITTSMWVK